MLLLLIVGNVVILTIQSAKDIYRHPRPTGPGYFREWEDYALFVIFVAFTIEVIARITVTGFIFNAEESRHTRTYRERINRFRARIEGNPVHAPVMQRSDSSSHPEFSGSKAAGWDYASTVNLDRSKQDESAAIHSSLHEPSQQMPQDVESKHSVYPPTAKSPATNGFPSRSNTEREETTSTSSNQRRKALRIHEDVPFVHALSAQRARNVNTAGQKAFLRHSWNRIDFLAVTAFWLVFFLASTGLESKHTLYIFRALAALRSARLLTVTNGTAVRLL